VLQLLHIASRRIVPVQNPAPVGTVNNTARTPLLFYRTYSLRLSQDGLYSLAIDSQAVKPAPLSVLMDLVALAGLRSHIDRSSSLAISRVVRPHALLHWAQNAKRARREET
jgi:hypothetical protein